MRAMLGRAERIVGQEPCGKRLSAIRRAHRHCVQLGADTGAPPRPCTPRDKWDEMQEDIDRVFGESHQELALLASRLLRHTPAR